MSFRAILLANLTTALGNTSVSSSAELPFSAADVPLYTKNMKKVYLDVDNTSKTELFTVLGSDKIYTTETTINGYLTVDAKNTLSDIDTIHTIVQNSRFAVANCYLRDCDLITEYTDDRITYNYLFTFFKV